MKKPTLKKHALAVVIVLFSAVAHAETTLGVTVVVSPCGTGGTITLPPLPKI